jgi:hypothetical protein
MRKSLLKPQNCAKRTSRDAFRLITVVQGLDFDSLQAQEVIEIALVWMILMRKGNSSLLTSAATEMGNTSLTL